LKSKIKITVNFYFKVVLVVRQDKKGDTMHARNSILPSHQTATGCLASSSS